MFYPWDSIKQEYSEEGIPFTFGEMTTEYYNTLSNSSEIPEMRDYGYYIDNVIGQGSNIYSTLADTSGTLADLGITNNTFYASEDYKIEKVVKYKITDTLYAEYTQNYRIDPTWSGSAEGEAVVLLSSWLTFKSTIFPYGFTINHMFTDRFGPLTFTELFEMNEGYDPFGYLAKNGYVFGLNAYPNSTDLVESSKTTTGCLIQGYKIFNAYESGFTSLGAFGIWQFNYHIFGIEGSEVNPYNKNADDYNFYIPEILGNGYIPQFPPSAEDNIIGGYNNDSDEGDIPSLPEQSAIRSGMVRMYQMTTTQLNAFAQFLWNTDLSEWDNFMNTLKQWFSNPLDSIISLSISPIDMFYNYTTKTKIEPNASNIKLGGFDTGVQGYQCPNNYIQVSLGKLSLKPYYKSFLDCNPHTKYSIYLPYIGFKDLDADVLFSKGGADIEVVYSIDVLTGVCVANVLIEKESNGTKLKHVIYTFGGNMNTTIPISSANMKDFISASVGAIASGVGMIASGGTITPVIMGSMLAQQGLNIASQKVNVSHSGGMALESGMFGIQYAYLIATRPREARPSNYKILNGIPSEIGGKLITFSGFTQVSSVKVDIPNATDEEKNEIEKLLKEGVFI